MEDKNPVPSKAEEQVAELSFLRAKHDMAGFLKKLETESKSALTHLVSILNDEEASSRDKFAAATKILDLRVAVSNDINRDQIQRLIAEINAKGKKMPKSLKTFGANGEGEDGDGEGGETDGNPEVNFQYIKKV